MRFPLIRLGQIVRLVAGLLFIFEPAGAQQVEDPGFKPAIASPAFADGKGPVVFIDEAHSNFHTASGRYQPFANVLRRDGYIVGASTANFDKAALSQAAVLVIANATGARNQPPFSAPIEPAFSNAEVAAVREWVDSGGSLLLIVDHFPWPDAARSLANALGVHFDSGTASEPDLRGPMIFRRSDHSLADHPIVNGRTAGERLDSLATFTGSAFKVDTGEPLLIFINPQAFAVTPRSSASLARAIHALQSKAGCKGQYCVLERGEWRCSARPQCSPRS